MSSKSSKEAGEEGSTRQISPAKHWVFTLNNYTPEDIKEIKFHSSIKNYIFQEEMGEEKTPHLQGYIEFNKKLRPLGLKMCNMKIHWEKAKHIKKAKEYACKEKTRIGHVFTNMKITIPRKIPIITELYDWQKNVVRTIKQEPDDRTIHWFYETKGGKGKTALAKYLVYHYNALFVSGNAKDMKYAIVANHAETGNWPNIIIMNIPRTMENKISWQGIESIKDGIFFSGKYESRSVLMPPVHFIIFANFPPDITTLSRDRWNIISLEDAEDVVPSGASPPYGDAAEGDE